MVHHGDMDHGKSSAPHELVKNKLKRVNHVNHADLVEKEMCGIYREK